MQVGDTADGERAAKPAKENEMETMSPIKAAQAAADSALGRYLGLTHACAAMHIPRCVEIAASDAYVAAGGRAAAIRVVGWGNSTHPVCGVTVCAFEAD